MPDFAKLTPRNVAAARAFSGIWDAFDEAPYSYHHHRQCLWRRPERVSLRDALTTPSGLHLNPSQHPASDTSFSSDATVPDSDPLGDLVWTGGYNFDLEREPQFPRLGWRTGYGRRWHEDPCGRVDLLLALPENANLTRVHGNHAFFNILPGSGIFAIKASTNDASTTMGSSHLRKEHGYRAILEPEVLLVFGELQFQFWYCVSEDDEAMFQAQKQGYMTKALQMELPIACASVTPSVRDVRLGEWVLLKNAGQGTESVVTAAISGTGNLRAVKQLSRRKTAKEKEMEVDQYKALQTRTAEHPGREHVLHYDATLGSAEIMNTSYIFFEPLVRHDFASLLLDPSKSVPRVQILCLFAQAVLGISAIHAAGFVHRDIKPGNLGVLSLDPPHAVILDLGCLMDIAPEPKEGVTPTPGLNGTLGYHAPETENIETRHGQPVDIWGLGAVGLQIFHAEFFAGVPWRGRFNPWRSLNTFSKHPLPAAADAGRQDAMYRAILQRFQRSEANGVDRLLAKMLSFNAAERPTAMQILADRALPRLLKQKGPVATSGAKRLAADL